MKIPVVFVSTFFICIIVSADEMTRIESIVQDIQSLRLKQKESEKALESCNEKILVEKEKQRLIQNKLYLCNKKIKNLEKNTFNEFPKLKMKSNVK